MTLFNEITKQFPEVSRKQTIGKSVESKDIMVLTLGKNFRDKETSIKANNPPSVFLTSAHHAREVVGVTMNIYVVLNLLHGYVNNNTGVNILLRDHNVYSLPLVNVDGYSLISDDWDRTHTFSYIRKNRRNDGNCIGESIGVDLNRNYGYKWGFDTIGSSTRKCDEDYRGANAFSEPETQAVRKFLTEDDKNIKIAINFHTWGNLFIIPFNYDDQWNKELMNMDIYRMYEDIRDSGNLPSGMLFGNGKQTIKYTANGDATDWMATINGIMSISPELGTSNKLTDKFFPNQEWVKPILTENFKWINYTLYKLSCQIETKVNRLSKYECTEDCTEEDEKYQIFDIEVKAENLGFAEAKNIKILVEETAPLEIVYVDNMNKADVMTKMNELAHPSLKSLESKTWILRGRILNEQWEQINNSSLIGAEGSKNFLRLISLKYPKIYTSESNVRVLSKSSLLSTEPNTMENRTMQPHENFLRWYLIGALIFILLSLIVCCGYRQYSNRRKGMEKLEDNEHRESELKDFDTKKVDDNESEDGRIGQL